MDPSASKFLAEYEESLHQALKIEGFPDSLLAEFEVLDCLAQHADKEIYTLRRREDGQLGLLRVTTEESPEQAFAEVEVLSRLDHPAIPKVLYAGTSKDRAFVVRTYFSGMSLEQALRQRGGRLPAREAVNMVVRLCDQLDSLHRNDPPVIHRDIKPQNIILSPDGELHLVDFGIARLYRPKEGADTVPLGTLPYAPPEQYGFMQTDARSDIFSLGMTLLRMITGEPNRTRLDEVRSKGLRAILRTAIALDPDQRYQTAARFKAALTGWLRGTRLRVVLGVAGGLAAAGLLFGAGVIGYQMGYDRGVQDILAPAAPAAGNPPSSYEEQMAQYQPLDFAEEVVALAVRNERNLEYDGEVTGWEAAHVAGLYIVGTYAQHSSIEPLTVKAISTGSVPELYVGNFPVARGSIASLEDLRSMTALRDVTLYSQMISDLSPLTGLPLKTLNLADNYISSVAPIKDTVTLRTLDLSLNPLEDLRPLARLTSLIELDLGHIYAKDLSPLSGMASLETLLIDHTPVESLSVIANYPRLKELSIGPVAPELLAQMGESLPVTWLSLWGAGDDVAQSLPQMPNLETLELPEGEGLTLTGLPALAPGVTTLKLRNGTIESLEGIEEWESLTYVDLSGSRVTDLSPLAQCKALDTIYLEQSQLKDLTPLAALEGQGVMIVTRGVASELVAPLRGIEGITLLEE